MWFQKQGNFKSNQNVSKDNLSSRLRLDWLEAVMSMREGLRDRDGCDRIQDEWGKEARGID